MNRNGTESLDDRRCMLGQHDFGQPGTSRSHTQTYGHGFDQGVRSCGDDRPRERYVYNDSMGARPSGADFDVGRQGDNTSDYGSPNDSCYETELYGAGVRDDRHGNDDFRGPSYDDADLARDHHDRGSQGGYEGGSLDYSAGMSDDYLRQTGRRDPLTGAGAPRRNGFMRGPKSDTRSDDQASPLVPHPFSSSSLGHHGPSARATSPSNRHFGTPRAAASQAVS